jgi:hypothetical protein
MTNKRRDVGTVPHRAIGQIRKFHGTSRRAAERRKKLAWGASPRNPDEQNAQAAERRQIATLRGRG